MLVRRNPETLTNLESFSGGATQMWQSWWISLAFPKCFVRTRVIDGAKEEKDQWYSLFNLCHMPRVRILMYEMRSDGQLYWIYPLCDSFIEFTACALWSQTEHQIPTYPRLFSPRSLCSLLQTSVRPTKHQIKCAKHNDRPINVAINRRHCRVIQIAIAWEYFQNVYHLFERNWVDRLAPKEWSGFHYDCSLVKCCDFQLTQLNLFALNGARAAISFVACICCFFRCSRNSWR